MSKRRELAHAQEAIVRNRVDELVERSAKAQRTAVGLVQRSRELLANADTKLALALTAARAGEWDLDLDTMMLAHSPRLDRVLGMPAISGGPVALFLDRLPLEHAERLQARLHENERRDWHEEVAFNVDGEGGGRWLSLRVRMMPDADGRPRRLIGVVTDVTERRRTQERLAATLAEKELLLREKDFLIKEIHHRVKNNLQMVGSLLSIQARTIVDADARALFDQALARVRVISRVHQRLYSDDELSSVDLSKHLHDLVTDTLSASGWEAAPLELKLASFVVTLDTAVPLSMALHELLVNAMKYAYGGAPGWIGVTLRAPTATQRTACLEVRDRGCGIDPAKPGGLGLRLVQSFARQLGGTMQIQPARRGGARVRISWSPRRIRNDQESLPLAP